MVMMVVVVVVVVVVVGGGGHEGLRPLNAHCWHILCHPLLPCPSQ